ncbi:hypothetical protein EV132_10254 [Rhizobium sullae]|uniref:Uncharacterized protein n=1 Tax=Rhizobium sullae TaxID=50338 RepID=A0A4R3QDM8_RHISU|nr:hypothetical protein EV132_10254 [Rhizobium sullae]
MVATSSGGRGSRLIARQSGRTKSSIDRRQSRRQSPLCEFEMRRHRQGNRAKIVKRLFRRNLAIGGENAANRLARSQLERLRFLAGQGQRIIV